MSIGTYERGTTFKAQVTYTSGSTNVDPSGSIAFIDIYKPDGTLYISNSGQSDATGVYYYYVSTQTDDPMGFYKIRWKAYFQYRNPWDYMPKYDSETVRIVDIE